MSISKLIEDSTILAKIGAVIMILGYLLFSIKVRSEVREKFPETDYIED